MNNIKENALWGLTHRFNVYVLWGRKTPKDWEDFLGEYATVADATYKQATTATVA